MVETVTQDTMMDIPTIQKGPLTFEENLQFVSQECNTISGLNLLKDLQVSCGLVLVFVICVFTISFF